MTTSTAATNDTPIANNPLTRFITKQEKRHLNQSQRLEKLEQGVSDLHATVSQLAKAQAVELKPLPEFKEKNKISLPEKVLTSIQKTAQGIFKYFTRYFISNKTQDDTQELRDEDMPQTAFPPKSEKPEDILASIRSYAGLAGTEASYYREIGLKDESSTDRTAYEANKDKVLDLAINEDITLKLVEKIKKIDFDSKAAPEDLITDKNIENLLDLFHCIVFDYKFDLPDSLLNIGIEEENQVEQLQNSFIEYLQRKEKKIPQKIIDLLELPELGSDEKPNISFSSVLVYWNLLYSIEQFQKSKSKSIEDFKEILKANFYHLLKLKQATDSNPVQNMRMDLEMKKQAFKEVEKFIEDDQPETSLVEYLKGKPELVKFIKDFRRKLIIDKLRDLRNNLSENEEPDKPDERFAAVMTKVQDESLMTRELLKNEDLKKLLPVIYSLVTFSCPNNQNLYKAYEDSYDDRKNHLGKTKRDLAMINLDKFLEDKIQKKALSNELPIILADLMHDCVLSDSEQAEAKLNAIVDKYKVE